MSVSLGTLHVSLEARLQKFNDGLRAATHELGRFETDTKRRTERIGHSLSTLGRNMSLGVTAPLVLMGKAAVDSATRFDSLRRSLDSLTGDSKETEKQLIRLREAAKLPGLGFRELIEGTVRLQSAGLSAREAEAALKGFGNAVALAGGSKEDLREVGVQLAQIASSGKLQGDELRIIAERVPQVRAVLKDAFGTASSEEIAKYGLSVEELLSKITTGLEKLPQATGGAQNAFDNFGDAVDDFTRAIGNSFLPAITKGLEGMTGGLQTATGWFNNLGSGAQTALAAIATGFAATGPLMIALGLFLQKLKDIQKLPIFGALFLPKNIPAVAAGALTVGAGAYAYGEAKSTGGLLEEAVRNETLRRQDVTRYLGAGGGLPGLRSAFGGGLMGLTPREQILAEQGQQAMQGMAYDPFTGKIRKKIPPVTNKQKQALDKEIKRAADEKRRRLEYMSEYSLEAKIELLELTGHPFKARVAQAELDRAQSVIRGADPAEADRVLAAKKKQIWADYAEWKANKDQKLSEIGSKAFEDQMKVAEKFQLSLQRTSGALGSLRDSATRRRAGGGPSWFRKGPVSEQLGAGQVAAGEELMRTAGQLAEMERQRAIDALLPAFKRPDALFGDEMIQELKPKIQPFTFKLGQELGNNLAMEMGREFSSAMDSVFGTKSPLARALSRTFGHLIDDLLNALMQRAIGNRLMISLFGSAGGVAAGAGGAALAGGAAAAGGAALGGEVLTGTVSGAGASAGVAWGTAFGIAAAGIAGAILIRRLFGPLSEGGRWAYGLTGFQPKFGGFGHGAGGSGTQGGIHGAGSMNPILVQFYNAKFNNEQDPRRTAESVAWHVRNQMVTRPGSG